MIYRATKIVMRTINKTVFLCSVSPLISWTFENSALAQIIPDASLGNETSRVVETGNSAVEIDGGAERGKNLFHSFEQFNVANEQSVFFSSHDGVENIMGRVTGNLPSKIQGKLGVIGNNADLFLINPNGIVFGKDATLDLNGSFLASTADSLLFNNGFQFSASNPVVPPLLTVNVPIGLQFGESANSIVNQSISGDSSGFQIGLQVKPGKTLALLGGDIFMEGGVLTAIDGRIELGSVAPLSKVELLTVNQGWALNYDNVPKFEDIKITKAQNNDSTRSLVQAFDYSNEFNLENGIIQVYGRNMEIDNGSQLIADGEIMVNAGKTLNLTGFIPLGEFNLFSGLVSQAISSENAGNISVKTEKLLIQDGARISAEVTGILDREGNLFPATGLGGNIVINALEFIKLIGKNSGILSATEGFGDAGDIQINTKNLTIEKETSISTESRGIDVFGNPLETGLSGTIEIDAQNITLNDSSLTSESRIGNQGNITIKNADTLLLNNNSEITTNAIEQATGGNITIDSDTIALLKNSNITANAVEGQGGNISITTQGIFQEPNSEITASSELGIDGTITINSPDVDPTSGLIELPDVPIDAEAILAEDFCQLEDEKIAKGSSFFITGRGGLTPTSEDSLENIDNVVGWATRDDIQVSENGTVGVRQRSPEEIETTHYPVVQQSQGWVTTADGSVWLVAHSPETIPQNTGLTHHDCGNSIHSQFD